MRQRWWSAVAGLCVLLSGQALASGPDSYTFFSSPVTPPHGFAWVLVLFWALSAFACAMVLRKDWAAGWKTAIGTGVALATCVGGFACFVSVMRHSFYVSYSAWGNPVFWGAGWRMTVPALLDNVLILLVIITVLPVFFREGFDGEVWIERGALLLFLPVLVVPGLLYSQGLVTVGIALLVGLFGIYKLFARDSWRKLRLVMLITAAYAVCLLPYFATGALSSGFSSDILCRYSSMYVFQNALMEYVHEHQGHLPDGRTLHAIIPQLTPYIIQYPDISHSEYCRGELLRQRHPRPYYWNPALAGKSVTELRHLPPSTVVFACPCHAHNRFTVENLFRYYDP